MRLTRIFPLALLLFAAGCAAQNPPAPLTPATKRLIEIQLRSRYNGIPQDVVFSYGERRPSQFPGYDLVAITLSRAERKSTIDFLVATDGKTLLPYDALKVENYLFSADGKQMVKLDRIDVATNPAADIDLKGRPIRLNPAAKVTLINFDDFQCPYCAQMHQLLANDIPKIYGDKIRIIYKDYPLVEIHPWAMHAAIVANCLNEQKSASYWSFADYIHANQAEVTKNAKGENRARPEQEAKLDELAMAQAKKDGLNTANLQACVKKNDEAAVRASMKEGDELGVDSTPTLFVNGERMSGALPLSVLRAMIDRALTSEGVPLPEEKTAADKPDAAKPNPAKPDATKH